MNLSVARFASWDSQAELKTKGDGLRKPPFVVATNFLLDLIIGILKSFAPFCISSFWKKKKKEQQTQKYPKISFPIKGNQKHWSISFKKCTTFGGSNTHTLTFLNSQCNIANKLFRQFNCLSTLRSLKKTASNISNPHLHTGKSFVACSKCSPQFLGPNFPLSWSMTTDY